MTGCVDWAQISVVLHIRQLKFDKSGLQQILYCILAARSHYSRLCAGWAQFIYEYLQGCGCQATQTCWTRQTCHRWTAWWWARRSKKHMIQSGCISRHRIHSSPQHMQLFSKAFCSTSLCMHSAVLQVHFELFNLSLPQTFPSKAVHLPCYITRVPIPFLLLTQDRFLVYSAYALEKSRSISISTAAVDWQKNRQLQFEKKKRKNNTGNLLNFNIYKMCKSPEPLFFIFCYRRDIFIYLFILLDFFRIVLRNSSPGFLKLLQSFSLYTGYSPVLPEECYS